jgi:hypothetical protein
MWGALSDEKSGLQFSFLDIVTLHTCPVCQLGVLFSALGLGPCVVHAPYTICKPQHMEPLLASSWLTLQCTNGVVPLCMSAAISHGEQTISRTTFRHRILFIRFLFHFSSCPRFGLFATNRKQIICLGIALVNSVLDLRVP